VDRYNIPFMQRALDLARQGTGLTSPNPMVGALIVRDGEVVGEGFHQYETRDHAEIVALRSAGEKAHGATLYVNLEPCCHIGRTGPCTDAIIAARLGRVVTAMEDPSEKVRGEGFKKLRETGIEVITGVLEEEAQRLNEAFACAAIYGKPFVTLKSAMTLDGQIALGTGRKNVRDEWITSEVSRAHVQIMRHASDALLTGIGTILADDPLLTDRSGLPRRRPLLRIVLDSTLRLPVHSRIVKAAKNDLLVLALHPINKARAKKLEAAGVEVTAARGKSGRLDLSAVLSKLAKRDILSVLLECGSELNGAALKARVVDKVFLFYAPKIAGAVAAPLATLPRKRDGVAFAPANTARKKNSSGGVLSNLILHRFGPDFAVEGYLHDVYGNR
jgi:diaminohydroxyphosphoribosylaminopyrimidine deaminase/5-amino-6-(5-phosphoribosylamino)uracil reductase